MSKLYKDKVLIIDIIEMPQTAEQTDKIDTIKAEVKNDCVGNCVALFNM